MQTETVKLCGLKEDEVLRRLAPFKDKGVNFDVVEDNLDVTITMTSELKKPAFDHIKSWVYRSFETEVYSAFGMGLAETAATLLKRNGRTLAVAESLTGGLVCAAITDIPGISANFFEGIVCYNKLSKTDRLGVKKTTLSNYGAVSKQTAIEMVRGLNVAPVDIGLATTGLAGPDGDEGKPVGLVYIGVGGGDFITAFERRLEGTREQIRKQTANLALYYLIKYLRGEVFTL